MNKLQGLFSNDIETFGPGTDLVVSLAAVLILMLAINTNAYKKKMLDLERVQENQKQLITGIAERYGTTPQSLNTELTRYRIMTSNDTTDYILVVNDVTLQRISFGGHILFKPNNHRLSEKGKKALTTVSNILKERLDPIKEILIQGHADILAPADSMYEDNLELAAQRAMTVFKFFKISGIDPVRHIMSASSFGEYKPVQREYSDINFNSEGLKKYNEKPEQRTLNRRIEIVLIYRQRSEIQ